MCHHLIHSILQPDGSTSPHCLISFINLILIISLKCQIHKWYPIGQALDPLSNIACINQGPYPLLSIPMHISVWITRRSPINPYSH